MAGAGASLVWPRMEREQIVRDDFPTTRKGWDPAAVRAHLESLAERLPTSDVSLADAAAQRVSEIVGAAEAVASGLEEEAEKRAEAIVESAREEADGIVERARQEARERLERAQSAVEGLIAGAEDLRSRVGSLGERLTGESDAAPSSTPSTPAAPAASVPPSPAAVVPGPELVAEPEVAVEPAKAQPTPTAAVPGPELVAEPEVDPEPAPEPEPAAPAPEPEPAAEAVSTEDLLAQLKGEPSSEPADAGETAKATDSDDTETDLAGIRLVALNLALEGHDREAIAARVEDEFGAVPGAGAVIDEVVDRAGK